MSGTIVSKPARELQVGDVFSTDGGRVESAVTLYDGRVSVRVFLDASGGIVKAATLAPDFICHLWVEAATAAAVGYVDSLGYIRCASCAQSAGATDGRGVYGAPHSDEPCDTCGTILTPNVLDACERLYMDGLVDEVSGDVEASTGHFYRVARYIVVTDSQGFHDLNTFATEAEARAAFAELNAEYSKWDSDDDDDDDADASEGL